MEEYFGKTIEKVRKKKNMSIKDLADGIMTPSTYHRFKNGEIETSVSKFNNLLNRLNLRYEEFIFINSHYQDDELKEALLTIENLFNRKDTSGMKKYQEQIKSQEWLNHLTQKHIISLISLLQSYLLNQKVEIKSNQLLHYLEQTETWTHYEIAMFANCMKVIPAKNLDFFLNNVVHSFNAYKGTNEYSHEISRILINAIISFLSRKEVRLARKWYVKLAAQSLEEHFLFERFFERLLKEYIEFAEGNQTCKNNFPLFVEHLKFLDCEQLAQTISTMNDWMELNYSENQ